MAQRPNWFRYYREKHDIPELGCQDDNELLLVSRETLRLALHGLRFAIAHAAETGETLHLPSQLAMDELNAVLIQRCDELPVATGRIFPLRQHKKKEPLNGQYQLRRAADVRSLHEIRRVRKNNRRTGWIR